MSDDDDFTTLYTCVIDPPDDPPAKPQKLPAVLLIVLGIVGVALSLAFIAGACWLVLL